MKRILITGGTSGLGKHMALALAKQHKVWFTYCKSQEQAQELEGQDKNLKALKCDFRDSKSVDELVAAISKKDIDVLVNNAITGFERNHFHKLDPEVFRKSFEENIMSTIKLSGEALRLFRKKRSGKIITVLTSALKAHPVSGWSEYLAQKAYLKSLARSWASENAKYGIVSNTISPSFMLTNLHKNIDQREVDMMEEKHPLGKALPPEKAVEAIKFLIETTEYINGIDIVINAAENVF